MADENGARLGDEAIEGLAEDRLKLGRYIFGLLRTMERAETPFTVGVFGSWGSGKTSFLNMLEDAALSDEYADERTCKWRVVRVNPWECDKPEDAKRLLASSLWAGLWCTPPWRWDLLKGQAWRDNATNSWLKLRAFWRRNPGVRGVVGQVVLALLSLVGRVLTGGVLPAGLGKAADKLFSSDASLAQQYRTYFKQDLRTALGENGRVLVLIDDLDRAPRKVIPEVLETIKLYLNQKDCVFVLAADPDMVREAIGELYSREGDEAREIKDRYLDKIVQLPFYLPRLNDKKTRAFFRHCSKLMRKNRMVNDTLRDLLIDKVFGRNPRAIKRFCMTHGFLAEVAPELDPNKLAKVLGIQMAFPKSFELYAMLPRLMFEDQEASRKPGEEAEQTAMLERRGRAKGEIGEERARHYMEAAGDTRLIDLLKTAPPLDEDDPEKYLSHTSVAAAPDGEPGDAFDNAMAWLKSEDYEKRAQGARALGSLGNRRALEPLIEVLVDEEAAVRANAAIALSDLGDTRAVGPLIARLKYESADVRANVVATLGDLGDARAVEPLIGRLMDKDENEHVRVHAAVALGQLGDARAVDPLIQRLEDRDESEGVRWRAAEALGELGDVRAVEPLRGKLNDDDPHVRAWVAHALARLGESDQAIVDRLMEALENGSLDRDAGGFNLRAAYVLGNLGEVVLEPLVPLLRSEDPDLRYNAATALGCTDSPKAVTPLLEALCNVDDPKWTGFAIALAMIGEAAVEPLREALRHINGKIRSRAAFALGESGTRAADAVEDLRRLGSDDPEGDVRDAASKAVSNIENPIKARIV